jgi:hypothetical protein
LEGTAVDLTALTVEHAGAARGVEHGDVLLAFAEAMVGEDDAALARARDLLGQRCGPQVMVDAAGVASNFERMVRIADATGIPLDERLASMSKEVREELHLERFAAAKKVSA